MPELEDAHYSRLENIATMDNYYSFLTKMYMSESQIIRPPAQGWPSIAHADLATLPSLGKSEEVLELLAHLPYVRRYHDWNHDADAAPGCLFAGWQGDIASLCDPTWHTTSRRSWA